jgi:hypothetical protein
VMQPLQVFGCLGRAAARQGLGSATTGLGFHKPGNRQLTDEQLIEIILAGQAMRELPALEPAVGAMTRLEDLAVMRARLVPAASALLFVALSADTAHAEQLPLEGGLYEITSRLELPHLERWAIDQTVSICLPNGTRMRSDFPLPVLSANNAFAGCLPENVQRTGASFEYDIVCAGRGASTAKAIYTLAPGEFRGRISMTMGAKNMTMTEVQIGHRLGGCALADTRRN